MAVPVVEVPIYKNALFIKGLNYLHLPDSKSNWTQNEGGFNLEKYKESFNQWDSRINLMTGSSYNGMVSSDRFYYDDSKSPEILINLTDKQ